MAECIQMPIGKYAAGMRAFSGAGKKLVVMFGQADGFAVDIYFGQAVGIEVNFGNVTGYFVPGWAWSYCHGFIINCLREFFVCHSDTDTSAGSVHRKIQIIFLCFSASVANLFLP